FLIAKKIVKIYRLINTIIKINFITLKNTNILFSINKFFKEFIEYFYVFLINFFFKYN
ncbi:hypothetical protein BDZ45DRAFT_609047, partial [Acephala macrosclerotiorum]